MPAPDRAGTLAREAAHFDAATDAAGVLARPITLADHVRFFLAPERFTKRAFEVLGECAGLRCADLGGGGGSAALVLAARGGRVTVCDVSGGALALARAQAAKFGVAERVGACRADALRLPVADGAFDRVLGLGILHHVAVGDHQKSIIQIPKAAGGPGAGLLEVLAQSPGGFRAN